MTDTSQRDLSLGDDGLDVQLADRWFANECSAEERHAILRWLEADPRRREALEQLRRQVTRPFQYPSSMSPEAAWERLRPSVHGRSRGMVRSQTNRWWRGVAALGLFAAAAFVLGLSLRWSPRASTPGHRYATGARQHATVALVDGSRMSLAPNTEAIVTMARDARMVAVRGEAHFEVVRRAGTPFTVRTGAITTRVIGTSFDVQWSPESRTGVVVVSSGKVVTRGAGTPLVLTAGTMARLADSVPVMVPGPMIASTDWAHGTLIFREAPVSLVLATLGRWYGYEFQLADATLASRHITASFLIDDRADMLRLVQRVLDVSLSYRDSVVTLRPQRHGASNAEQPSLRDDTFFRSQRTEVGR